MNHYVDKSNSLTVETRKSLLSKFRTRPIYENLHLLGTTVIPTLLCRSSTNKSCLKRDAKPLEYEHMFLRVALHEGVLMQKA